MSQLLSMPLLTYPDSNGDPRPGALANFYATGTTTRQNVYTDANLTVPHENPVEADSAGYFPVIYLDTSVSAYRLVLTDSTGADSVTIDPVLSELDTEQVIAALDSLQLTQAEISAGITPTNYSYSANDIDVRRYGIFPNDASLANSNTLALKALLNPSVTGPVGRLFFAPITGVDTYYFNDIVQIRDGIRMDLCGCTLNFAKTFAASDSYNGFLTFIRNVSVCNGSIVVNYNGTGGTNAGMAIRIGGRQNYGFGSNPVNFDEEGLSVPMGNCELRNLRISTNNPATVAVLLVGGLRNVILENIEVDGLGTTSGDGIYYEFGDYHYDSTAASHTTTHGSEMVFRNIRVKNIASVSGGSGLSLVGAYNALVENLHVDTANVGFSFRPGEALFYNVGTPDVALTKRAITLRNIVAKNVTTGMSLVGAELASGGYLSGSSLTEAQQTDLMHFSVDGGSLYATGVGISVSGSCDVRNVIAHGPSSSGQLIITDECMRGVFTNCTFKDSAGIGVRASFGGNIWATARLKTLIFDDCKVTGNTGAGYSIGHSQSVLIRGGRIGNQAVVDGVAETTQTPGVSVSATSLGGGVYCEGVDVAVSSGTAYSITGTIVNHCGISNAKGTVTTTGNWDVDGVARASSANIADKTAPINIKNKYAGRMCYDTSNTRLMIAQGSTDVSTWIVADASATVTPV